MAAPSEDVSSKKQQSYTLIDFVNNEATRAEKTEFADSWPWYIRLVMGVSKTSRHVWPYNVSFMLRAALANLHRESSERNIDLSTIDALTDALDWRISGRDNDTIDDVPGTIANSLNETRLKDPYAFTDDSVIYRTWKTVSAAIPIIDESISNLELQTRQLTMKNAQLVEQIDRIGQLTFVQNGFIEKFKLINERSSQ